MNRPLAAKRQKPDPDRMYRGIEVQKTGGRSQFTTDQIKRAVEVAIAKHADERAGGK